MKNTLEGDQDITEFIQVSDNPRAKYLRDRVRFLNQQLGSLNSRLRSSMLSASTEFITTAVLVGTAFDTIGRDPDLQQKVIGFSALAAAFIAFSMGVRESHLAITIHDQITSNQMEAANYRQILAQAYLTNAV